MPRPNQTKIKLCGLRTEADVDCAVALAVDAIGFVLVDSPRMIDPATCTALRQRIPSTIRVHGVYAHTTPDFIQQTLADCNLDVAQIHGHDHPENAADFWTALHDTPTLRAFRVRGAETLAQLEAVRGETFLLDAYVPGVAGGTGATFDWTLAAQANAYGKVILAGGLTPENVATAIQSAAPYMVDVSGGIECASGVKDAGRMRAFVAAVREMENAPGEAI